jgi:predicted neutral ceramidase superfamily lipid hydrolase
MAGSRAGLYTMEKESSLRIGRNEAAITRGITMAPASRTMREGLVVGLAAYAAVAVFYAVFDLLAARGTLYTVNLLGMAVFRGARDPAILQLPVPLDLKAIFWYNALHLVISLAIGLIVVRLVAQAERDPSQAYLLLFIMVAGFVLTIFGVGLLTTSMRAVLPWWSIVVANSLAVLLAGWYLLRKHPGIWHRLVPFSG